MKARVTLFRLYYKKINYKTGNKKTVLTEKCFLKFDSGLFAQNYARATSLLTVAFRSRHLGSRTRTHPRSRDQERDATDNEREACVTIRSKARDYRSSAAREKKRLVNECDVSSWLELFQPWCSASDSAMLSRVNRSLQTGKVPRRIDLMLSHLFSQRIVYTHTHIHTYTHKTHTHIHAQLCMYACIRVFSHTWVLPATYSLTQLSIHESTNSLFQLQSYKLALISKPVFERNKKKTD